MAEITSATISFTGGNLGSFRSAVTKPFNLTNERQVMGKKVHLVMIDHALMEEYTVVSEILTSYGLDVIRSYETDYNGTYDAAILGCPKNMKNMATARPIKAGKYTVVRIPRLAQKFNDEYNRTRMEMIRGAHIAGKAISGKGFEIGGFSYNDQLTATNFIDRVKKWKPMVGEYMTIDFETTGLNPETDKIVTMALLCNQFKQVLVFDKWDDIAAVINHLVDVQVPLCAHNAKFEQKWILSVTGGEAANFVLDTQVNMALLWEDCGKSLDLGAVHVGCAGYDMPMEEFLNPLAGKKGETFKFKLSDKNGRRRHHEAPPELLNSYNAKDVFVTDKLARYTMKKLYDEPADMTDVMTWLVRGQTMLARMETAGIQIDAERVIETHAAYNREIESISSSIRKEAAKYGMTDFNPTSSVQVINLLFNKMCYPVFKLTNKKWVHPSKYVKDWWKGVGNPSGDKEALDLLLSHNPDDKFVQSLVRLNHITALQNGIVSRCMETALSGKGAVHSNFDATKLLTGQLSSTEPPMMNVPKNEFRRVFVSRFGEEGGLLEIDYSQLHLRIIGALASCPAFIEAYNNGVDLHSRTAAGVIARCDESKFITKIQAQDKAAKKQRDLAKRTNFSIIFEVGAKSLALKTGHTEAECKEVITNWFKFYPEIKDQIERQHQFAEKRGYIVSPFGRVRHLPFAMSNDRTLKFRALRQSGDFKVSNTGRYMTLYGMILCDDEIIEQGMQSRLVCQVHDSILFDVHKSEFDEVVKMVQRHCVQFIEEFCSDWMSTIPIVMEGFYGPNWYEGDAWKRVYVDSNKVEIK